MSEEDRPTAEQLAPALGLLAHDLRNPASAILANLNFLESVRDMLPPDERDALADAVVATRELITGIEHLGWLARAIRSEPIVALADADVCQAVRTFAARTPRVRVQLPDQPLRARAGNGLVRVLELLASNASQHAPGKPVHVRAERVGADVVVTFLDDASPIAEALRAEAFTVPGQMNLKGRADGRYGRMLGLAAVGVLVHAMKATIVARDEEGIAAFVITLASA